jgi:hypothetical protein
LCVLHQSSSVSQQANTKTHTLSSHSFISLSFIHSHHAPPPPPHLPLVFTQAAKLEQRAVERERALLPQPLPPRPRRGPPPGMAGAEYRPSNPNPSAAAANAAATAAAADEASAAAAVRSAPLLPSLVARSLALCTDQWMSEGLNGRWKQHGVEYHHSTVPRHRIDVFRSWVRTRIGGCLISTSLSGTGVSVPCALGGGGGGGGGVGRAPTTSVNFRGLAAHGCRRCWAVGAAALTQLALRRRAGAGWAVRLGDVDGQARGRADESVRSSRGVASASSPARAWPPAHRIVASSVVSAASGIAVRTGRRLARGRGRDSGRRRRRRRRPAAAGGVAGWRSRWVGAGRRRGRHR